MGGKSSLLLVLGFTLAFLLVLRQSSGLLGRSTDNMVNFNANQIQKNIASSGANMALSELMRNSNWNTGYNNVAFQGGVLNTTISNSPFFDTLWINSSADLPGLPDYKIRVGLDRIAFNYYGYYANKWGTGYLVKGDTVSGPFHTNDILNTYNDPVFLGTVSAKGGINKQGTETPKFLGGMPSIGKDIPFNIDATKLPGIAQTGGRFIYDSSGANKSIDMRVIFQANGTAKIQEKLTSSGTWGSVKTVDLSTYAPNGVIFNKSGNIYLSGTVNGKYTIGTGKASDGNQGRVYLEDDIKYREVPFTIDPTTKEAKINQNCTDMLGIVAMKQIEVLINTANKDNIIIDAACLNHDGGITVKGLTPSSPKMGKMILRGSLIEDAAQITGYFNGAGYNQILRYDPRFTTLSPPAFPETNVYRIASWFE